MGESITHSNLSAAIAAIPPGKWAVGVSGGADSVALLMLLSKRPDLKLHVVHLNHETRGHESEADAKFVAARAEERQTPCTIATISELALPALPRNVSARFRAARMFLFDQVVSTNQLQGVILAHHADDQAETILQRLLRGSGPAGLVGIRYETSIHRLTVLHPLLSCRRSELRQELVERKVSWREDVSNDSAQYLRNRLRRLLQARPELFEAVFTLGQACHAYSRALEQHAPLLGRRFNVNDLRDFPLPLGRHAARRWLLENGAAADQISAATASRLIAMASDAATSARQYFPGNLLVRRTKGTMTVEIENGSAESESVRKPVVE